MARQGRVILRSRGGFVTAVTTRRGAVRRTRATSHALPRVSLNGNYRRALRRFVPSGAPFALWNKGKQIDVA
jgi:hypothetical protein